MLRVYAHTYIELGQRIQQATALFDGIAIAKERGMLPNASQPTLDEKMRLHNLLQEMSNLCGQLGLPVAQSLIDHAMVDVPDTSKEFNILVNAVTAELKTKLFVYIPHERHQFVENMRPRMAEFNPEFPRSSEEIATACRSFICGLPTAAVFHAMRACEVGIQVLAKDLGVTFPYPLELAEWGKIVGELEPKINAFKVGPRSTEKDENLKFYSELAAQFRYFNNGWRIRVSHARESYTEDQAREIIDHVISFFAKMNEKLSENP